MKDKLRLGEVHEHLDDYFKNGWVIKMWVPVVSGHGAGGGDTSTIKTGANGWLAVLLEK